MPIQIVMDHRGDSRYRFDPDNATELAEAKDRFARLTGSGYTAAVRTAAGVSSKINSFDPAARETLFFPRLIGG
jgi:hypothetical protein